MEFIGIAGMAIGGLALAACSPRKSEREILRHLPIDARLRIYAPFVSWRDSVALKDHAAIESLRLRVSISLPILVALPIIMTWALSPARDNVEPSSPLNDTATSVPARIPQAPHVAPSSKMDPHAPPAPNPPTIDSAEALAELRTPSRLYGTAKVKPVYRVHDVEGARITSIDPNSFWAMLGVREGDVVIELHGERLDNPATLVALMNALERDAHVEMVVRGTDGTVRYLEYRNPYTR